MSISKELVDEIQRRLDESIGEFNSVEDFIEFALTEVLRKEEQEQPYTHEEEEEIKKRLRALGYIE